METTLERADRESLSQRVSLEQRLKLRREYSYKNLKDIKLSDFCLLKITTAVTWRVNCY